MNNNVIILGTDCYARMILTDLEFKPSKKNGELTMVFDLIQCSYKNCIKYLNTKFKYFFDNLEIKQSIHDTMHFEFKCIENGYGTRFVHESYTLNSEFTSNKELSYETTNSNFINFHANNFEALEKRFTERIENLYKCITCSNIFVCMYYGDFNTDIIAELVNCIENNFGIQNPKLYVINIHFDENILPLKKLHNNTIHLSIGLRDGLWNNTMYNRVKNMIQKDHSFFLK